MSLTSGSLPLALRLPLAVAQQQEGATELSLSALRGTTTAKRRSSAGASCNDLHKRPGSTQQAIGGEHHLASQTRSEEEDRGLTDFHYSFATIEACRAGSKKLAVL